MVPYFILILLKVRLIHQKFGFNSSDLQIQINQFSSVTYLLTTYLEFTVYTKIFRRKDITLTRNHVIRICIQNTPVPPIAGYF